MRKVGTDTSGTRAATYTGCVARQSRSDGMGLGPRDRNQYRREKLAARVAQGAHGLRPTISWPGGRRPPGGGRPDRCGLRCGCVPTALREQRQYPNAARSRRRGAERHLRDDKNTRAGNDARQQHATPGPVNMPNAVPRSSECSVGNKSRKDSWVTHMQSPQCRPQHHDCDIRRESGASFSAMSTKSRGQQAIAADTVRQSYCGPS